MSNTPLEVFEASQSNAHILNNTNFDVVAAEQRREVIDQVNAEPSLILTNSRNFYIVGDVPTGTVPWTDNPKKLALWRGSAWFFWTPARNQIYSKPDGTLFEWDGTNWGIPSGGALNVSSSVKTDRQTLTSSTYTDVTDLTVTITPSNASAKIKIDVALTGGASGGNPGFFNIQSNESASFVTIPGLSSTAGGVADTNDAWASVGQFTLSDRNRASEGRSISFIHEPGVTSAVTYKIQMKNNTGSETVICNGTDLNSDKAGISTIVAQELK